MTEQLQEIGMRIAALREIMDYTPEQLAAACGVTVEELHQYEAGQKDFSFSFLYAVANVLGVDVLDIMSGESPKLSVACMVRSGGGYTIERRKAYSYKHLAYTFRKKKAEPFMVTVEPNEVETPTLHSHEGQEFNYMVEGSMSFFLDDMVYQLDPGDSIYFDSGTAHAMKARNGKPAKFLAIVMN